MKKTLKALSVALAACMLFLSLNLSSFAEPESTVLNENPVESELNLACKSAVLMEATTGKILYVQNPDEALPPASVTKIMTLLLVMEAIDSGSIKLDDMVTASANAVSMGGSQIYLKEGESMSVEDMLKSVVISSANDAAVALAEYVAGSEEAFVKKMNERAKELGMENTHFENTNGLDDTVENHVTSARDIAIMSAELIKHKKILEYSSIWMDTIRNGEFGLTNTNRLVRFYKGCTGLKTGSTSKAKFCVSVTAERNDLSLVCVIMGAESRDIRNAEATKLLDWGFANYSMFREEAKELQNLRILGGVKKECAIGYEPFSCVVKKGDEKKIECRLELGESVSAPIKIGDKVGEMKYYCNNEEIGSSDILAKEGIEKISFFGVFSRILCGFCLK